MFSAPLSTLPPVNLLTDGLCLLAFLASLRCCLPSYDRFDFSYLSVFLLYIEYSPILVCFNWSIRQRGRDVCDAVQYYVSELATLDFPSLASPYEDSCDRCVYSPNSNTLHTFTCNLLS